MNLSVSTSDLEFQKSVESCDYPVDKFDHRAHIRLAYIYLVSLPADKAVTSMRDTIFGLLNHLGIEPMEKYHETITQAWVLAIHHFMATTKSASSAEDFIDQNERLLDTSIMLSHYTDTVLFSENARHRFCEPDLEPIPRH